MIPSHRIATAAAAAFIIAAAPAAAQTYPSKPVRLVTQAVGGGIDFTARLLAHGLTDRLGQQIIVDNRGGTNVAPQTVAKANPDGYTLLVHNNTVWIAPILEEVPYDHEKELAPITLTSRAPNVLVIHPSLGVNSVKELIAKAKAAPGEINYASGPIGASNHIAAELFKAMAGVNLTRIGYKGGGPAFNDVLAGQVKVMFASAGTIAGHVKSGKLRALGVSSAEPSPLMPGMPTIASLGVPGYASEAIYGFWAPAKTPPAIIARLNQEAIRVLQTPEIREKFLAGGVEAIGTTPQQFGAEIKAESTRLSKLFKATGVR